MINIALLVISIVMFVAIVVASIYLLVYFQHEADRNTAIFPKIVTITGLTLTCCLILLLPVDVGNRGNDTVRMDIIWQVAYIMAGVMILAVIPFTLFYYEAEDPDEKRRIKQVTEGLKYMFATLIIFFVITVILWITIGTAQVQVEHIQFPSSNLRDGLISFAKITPDVFNATTNDAISGETLKFKVTLVLYIISILNLMGVILLVLFGGIGLASLPYDLLTAWRYRPRYMTKAAYLAYKEPIGEKAAQMIEIGQKMKERYKRQGGQPSGRRQRNAYNKFRKDVYLLEERFQTLEKAYNVGQGPKLLTVVWAWAQMVLGIFAISTSLLWVVQIFIVLLIRSTSTVFLSTMFNKLDEAFALFGVVAYGIFAFYLLLCCFAGNFKFGLRVPLLFSIHPMKVGETMMNAFLFNTLLLLTVSIAVVQFCTDAFGAYARLTSSDVIFNTGVKSLKFTGYIWIWYPFALIVVFFVSLAYFVAFPMLRSKRDKNGFLIELPKGR